MTPSELPRILRPLIESRAAGACVDLLLLDLTGDEDARPVTREDANEVARRLETADPHDVVRIGRALDPHGQLASCVVFGPADAIDVLEISDATTN